MGLALTVIENTCGRVCPLANVLHDTSADRAKAAINLNEKVVGLEEAVEYWVDAAAMEAEAKREAEKTSNALKIEVQRLNSVVAELKEGLDYISNTLGRMVD